MTSYRLNCLSTFHDVMTQTKFFTSIKQMLVSNQRDSIAMFTPWIRLYRYGRSMMCMVCPQFRALSGDAVSLGGTTIRSLRDGEHHG